MTKNDVTAGEVNSRVDQMGHVFNGLQRRVKNIEDAFKVRTPAMTELATLRTEMAQLQEAILAAPGEERETQLALVEAKQSLEVIEDDLEDIEGEIYLNVTAELDDDNKPVYTNAASREHAANLALRGHDGYQTTLKLKRSVEMEKARLDARLSELERRDKANRLVFNGLVARLENLTARMNHK